MSRPLLFRLGSTTSPCFDRVRDLDIPVVAGMVKPSTGGVSTFAVKAPDRDAWVLECEASLGSGLEAINDRGSHCIIQPTESMPLKVFVDMRSTLNTRAVKHAGQAARAQVSPSARPQSILAPYSKHEHRATRFVFDALADAVHERIAIYGWDDDDYDFVAVVANALEHGEVTISSLAWDPNGAKGWTKEMAFVARAVDAYMKHVEAQATGNEDLEADMGNDHALLRIMLKLEGDKNILSALSQSGEP